MAATQSPLLDLDAVLANAQLSALPQSAIRLLELSQDPTNGPDVFATPIESDPGLAGQVLKFVNSSYFGFSREISGVKSAITLVGIRTVKNFALWSAVFSLMPNPKCGPFDLKSLWQDSLRRALFARAMAKSLDSSDSEEAFSAALLQDMAIPLLANEAPEVYERLLKARQGGAIRLSGLEQRVFGWDHAQAGGKMARHWNLPEAFAVMIENHYDVEHWIGQPEMDLGKVAVSLSSLLPTTVDGTWAEASKFVACYDKVAPAGSLTVSQMLEKTDEEFADMAPVLQITTPRKTLVDWYDDVIDSID